MRLPRTLTKCLPSLQPLGSPTALRSLQQPSRIGRALSPRRILSTLVPAQPQRPHRPSQAVGPQRLVRRRSRHSPLRPRPAPWYSAAASGPSQHSIDLGSQDPTTMSEPCSSTTHTAELLPLIVPTATTNLAPAAPQLPTGRRREEHLLQEQHTAPWRLERTSLHVVQRHARLPLHGSSRTARLSAYTLRRVWRASPSHARGTRHHGRPRRARRCDRFGTHALQPAPGFELPARESRSHHAQANRQAHPSPGRQPRPRHPRRKEHQQVRLQQPEFREMRYQACTSDPDTFIDDKYTLRPWLYGRETEMAIVLTCYNEDDVLFARTMGGRHQEHRPSLQPHPFQDLGSRCVEEGGGHHRRRRPQKGQRAHAQGARPHGLLQRGRHEGPRPQEARRGAHLRVHHTRAGHREGRGPGDALPDPGGLLPQGAEQEEAQQSSLVL